MSGAEHSSSSAMRLRSTWRTLGEWVRQPAPAQAGPGILSTLLLILCATYQGGMIGSAVLTGRVGDGDLVAGIAPTRIGFAILIVAVMGSTALLTARRRYALAVFLAECAVYVVASALGLNNFFLFPVLVALGSAVSRLPLWQHLAVIGAAFLMATASAVLVAPPEVLMEEWLSQVVAVLLTVIAAMMARSVANWRAAQAGARAARERFRALRAERDRAVNRADIAAELHDSVGHGLTTIIALSEGLAGGADPEIDEALGGINEVARECLEQTRRAVRALADAEDEPADSPDWDGAGRRTWDEIRNVVGRMRSLGVTVVFTETGQRADDDAQADLCFVLTREALTNAVRHAPALSQVQVSWDHGESAVTVTVRNDGASGDRGGEDNGCCGGAAEGTGLLRLRDRVEAVGGSLDWGPESDGGWLVTATVPRTRGEG
ncbi:two-component sensor histidine kinase [Actinomyces oris K20]|uniref:sensor histidine kinase n=1 Tax=Actinomyces oris TaxID=544580 RepID=UPI0002003B1D|nr:histidine kinase [Actinomyces oris]BDF97875.1 two-component sensor histidine kinase [Actinomyces oris K20]